MSGDTPNPYAPPLAPTDAKARPVSRDTESLRADCVRRTWLTRTIRLSGRVEADVRYDAKGTGERVYVNDSLVAETSPFYLWHNVAPEVDFAIETTQRSVPVSLDVRVSILQLLRITCFQLRVDGRLVYHEGPPNWTPKRFRAQ